ncbi:hypothetical protein [Bradyrhizobium sp. Tv2a-2]|uniref:hypothetical protein n=1 Tax=Bradyrhizobium sp. Tv2a-2 TaxID=113395 RepID=UPI00040681C1|nr:hypothetical protein [Bradyrhizobium sp. Tv2a-2]
MVIAWSLTADRKPAGLEGSAALSADFAAKSSAIFEQSANSATALSAIGTMIRTRDSIQFHRAQA